MKRWSIVVGVLGMAALGLTQVASTSTAKPSGQNGRIVFARCVTYTPECEDFLTYTANPDGSNVRFLAAGASYSPNPRWSPNGTEIALAEPKTQAPGCPAASICTAIVVNPDKATYRGISWPLPGAWDVDCFAWSPDGLRLACGAEGDYETGTTLSGIYTVRASDGGDAQRITACSECVPSDFSPDGKRILYALSEDGSNVGLFSVKINGAGVRQITPDWLLFPHGGSWSPTGNKIVFQAQQPGEFFSVWTVNADGSDVHQVPIAGCGTAIRCRLPSWSPDGTKIVFSVRSPGGPSQVAGIYTVNADGSDLARLTNNGLGDTQPDWGTHPAS